MKMSDLDLNDHHEAIIINYMKFARYQRTHNLKSVEYSFKDTMESRLLEDTYTSDEVQELLSSLCKVVQADIETELINTCHSNVLLLKQLFKQAEKWHLRLQADLSQLENKEMLEAIRAIENHELMGIFPEKSGSSPSKVKLQPLNDSQGPLSLLNLEIDRLKVENEKLRESLSESEKRATHFQDEFDRLEGELDKSLQERKDLQSQVKDVPEVLHLDEIESELAETKNKLIADKEQATSEQQHLQNELEMARERVLEVQSQLQLAEQELERKFSETVAYTNMKKMLAKKNELIKSLRVQLNVTHLSEGKIDG